MIVDLTNKKVAQYVYMFNFLPTAAIWAINCCRKLQVTTEENITACSSRLQGTAGDHKLGQRGNFIVTQMSKPQISWKT